MRLVKKNFKTQTITKVWTEQKKDGEVEKRKLFTCYDTTIEDIEKILKIEYTEK